MGTEFELKYRAPHPQVLDAILEGSSPVTYQRATTYFDTPDRAFSARKWTVRVRQENERSVVTCKTPGANNCRGEWDTDGAHPLEALAALVSKGAPGELLEIRDLIPVCGARFTRRAVTVDLGDAVAELACDLGCLTGGGKECPLCEVEVELKSGNPDTVVRYAETIARKSHLEPEPKSKFQRANALSKED